MLLVRTGGLCVLVALIVAGIFMFVVRPAINDTTHRALDTADRALDQAQQQADDITSTLAEATADGDYLSAAAFGATVRTSRPSSATTPELLDLTGATGGRRQRQVPDRRPRRRPHLGPGRDGLRARRRHARRLGQAGGQRLPDRQAVSRREQRSSPPPSRAKAGAGAEVETMTPSLAPVTGAVQWTVTADEGDGRALVFTAKPDGSGLRAAD